MPSRDSVCGPRVGVKPIRLDCREKGAVGQDGGAPVLRASEPERAARGGASRAARVPGQVRGKQGEGQCAATPPSGAVRPGLIRSLTDRLGFRCTRFPRASRRRAGGNAKSGRGARWWGLGRPARSPRGIVIVSWQ